MYIKCLTKQVFFDREAAIIVGIQNIYFSRDSSVPAGSALKVFFQRFFDVHFFLIEVDDPSAGAVNFDKRPRTDVVQRANANITLRNSILSYVIAIYGGPLLFCDVGTATNPI